jgi:uncharacterized protein YkwD
MFNVVKTVLSRLRRLRGSPAPAARRPQLSVEALEDRRVPSAAFLRHHPHPGPPHQHFGHHRNFHHQPVIQAPAPALNNPPVTDGGGTTQGGGGLDLSGFAQLLEVRDLMNAERQKVGLAPLTIEPHLQAVAWNYAATLARLDLWNGSNHHEDDPGATDADAVHNRQVAGGYTGSWWGENIEWSQGPPNAQVAMYGDGSANPWQGWMNSPPHRANILNPAFTDVGVAAWLSGQGHLYWAVEFGGP